MNKLIAIIVAAAFSAGTAYAQAPQPDTPPHAVEQPHKKPLPKPKPKPKHKKVHKKIIQKAPMDEPGHPR